MSTTTYINFQPSQQAPFQFQATLDGSQYTVIVTWNFAAQRWYISTYALTGALVISCAMVGSPVGFNISLVMNLFTDQLVYRIDNLQFEVINF